MPQMTLYCPSTPSLKLGPGTTQIQQLPAGRDGDKEPIDTTGDVLVFFEGFAVFDTERFPDWERWVNHPGTPHIEVLGSNDEGRVPDGSGVTCPECGKTFAGQKQLNGHLMGHANAARKATVNA